MSRQPDLAPLERKRLVAAISDRLRPLMLDLDIIKSEKELRKVAEDSAIKYADLNGDGVPEVIAQGLGEKADCSATGNCPLWIFELHDGKYEPLLDSQAQTFTIQSKKSKGYQGIVLSRHDSAFSSDVKFFEFDGQLYRETGCYFATSEVAGPGNEYHYLKDPQMTPCKTK